MGNHLGLLFLNPSNSLVKPSRERKTKLLVGIPNSVSFPLCGTMHREGGAFMEPFEQFGRTYLKERSYPDRVRGPESFVGLSPVSVMHLTVRASPASCQPLFEYFQVYPVSLGHLLSSVEYA